MDLNGHRFNGNAPIWTQLTELFTAAIASGELGPGQRLPTVRDVALEAGVNPNTVQRAMAELERGGLVRSERGSGRFVTDDTAAISRAGEELARERVRDFLRAMGALGWGRDRIISLIERESEDI